MVEAVTSEFFFATLFQKPACMSTKLLRDYQRKKAAIFDLDGTLIDTAGDLAASMNHVLVSNDVPAIPHEDVRHLVGFGARAMLKAGFERSVGVAPNDEVLQGLVKDFVEYYHANIAVYSKPFEGMEETLELLKVQNVQLAVCTNKPEGLARHLLETLDLTHWFAAIVGGDTAGVAKPDPAPVNLCLEAMAFDLSGPVITDTQTAVFVGDSDTDINAAAAVEIPCLVASFGYGPLNELSDATPVFDSYIKTPDMLLSMLAH